MLSVCTDALFCFIAFPRVRCFVLKAALMTCCLGCQSTESVWVVLGGYICMYVCMCGYGRLWGVVHSYRWHGHMLRHSVQLIGATWRHCLCFLPMDGVPASTSLRLSLATPTQPPPPHLPTNNPAAPSRLRQWCLSF